MQLNYWFSGSICREGDEFVDPFVAKLKGEVPEARVTLEAAGEEGTEQKGERLACSIESDDVRVSEGLFEFFVNEKLIFSKHYLKWDIQPLKY